MRLNTRLRVAALLGSALCGPGIAAAVEETGSEPVQVSSGATKGPQHRPALPRVAVTAGGERLVAWLQPIDREVPQRYRLWARALDETNMPLGEPFAISPAERDGKALAVWSVAVEQSADGFLAVWAEGTGDSLETELVARRVRTDGKPTGRTQIVAPRGGDADLIYHRERNEFVVVWSDGRSIKAQRLRANGSLTGEAVRLWRSPDEDGIVATGPSVAYDSDHDRYLAVWSAEQHGDRGVFGRTIPGRASGRLGRTWRLGPRSPDPTSPDVAYSSARREFLVVSEDVGRLLLTRVDRRGQIGKSMHLRGNDYSRANFSAIAARGDGDHVIGYTFAGTPYYRHLGRRLRLGRERRVWTGPQDYESSGSVLTTTRSGFGLAWVQALGPDDDEGPQFHYADREVFFRELSARR